MDDKKFVKPAAVGAVVRFPTDLKRVLKQEGEEVPWNTYWQRRFIAGDINVPSATPQEVDAREELKKKRKAN